MDTLPTLPPQLPLVYVKFCRMFQSGLDESSWYGAKEAKHACHGEFLLWGQVNDATGRVEYVCPD